MYCKECGNKIDHSDNFCGFCGNRLQQPVSPPPATGDDETSFTVFKIKNEISGEEETVKVNKDTFKQPILLGSGPECDVILKNTEDSIIFEQHALLGHMGHHTYLRTKRDENGKIPADVNKYGHLAKFDDSDYRLSGVYQFRIGHYTIRVV